MPSIEIKTTSLRNVTRAAMLCGALFAFAGSGAVRDLVLKLRCIAMAASRDDFAGAAQACAGYRRMAAAAAPKLILAARWSLFNPAVREVHFRALR